MPRTKTPPVLRDRIIDLRRLPASALQDHQHNWRVHPQAQRDALQGVLHELGIASALLVYDSPRQGGLCVIDGHLRKSLDPTQEWPCLMLDLDDDEASYLLATHDPLGAMAEASREALARVLADVTSGQASVQELLAQLAEQHGVVPSDTQGPLVDVEPEMDRAEALRQQYGAEVGQLWACGVHRVICGDCTEKAVVERLMHGKHASAVLTDPPYGQNQPGIPGDAPENHVALLHGCLLAMPCRDGVLVSFCSPRTFPTWLDASRQAGWTFERLLWLYKAAQETFPWRGWLLKSEAILVSSRGVASWQDVHPYTHDCYYKSEVSGELDASLGWHGSVKPFDVVSDILCRISRQGQTVYDPFLGSGTTLIAAHQLQRRCYGIEIDPGYVAVTLHRYATLTGETPVLVEG